MDTKIKVFLVDDEIDSIELLLILLKKYEQEIEIIGYATDSKIAFENIKNLKPDLVFLDIQMPKMNGFELLSKFESHFFEIIFTTSFNQFAINAIKCNALDYLLKPIDIEELDEAILNAVSKIASKKSNQAQVINLINYFDADIKIRKIAIHKGENVILIPTNEIVYIESDGRYCQITMQNTEKHIITRTLKEIYDYLHDMKSFVKINKSIIINTTFLLEYSKKEPFYIKLIDNYIFEIPRRKKGEILELLK